MESEASESPSNDVGKAADAVLARILARCPADQVEETSRADERERSSRSALVMSLAHDLGGRYSPQRATFDNYIVARDDQAEMMRRLRALAEQLPEAVARGESVLFYGAVGTGKDHLMAALLYQAAARHGIDGKWISGQDLYGRWRDRMDTKQPEEELLRDFAKPKILAISDPLPAVGDPSAWQMSQLYRLLDRRYRALMPTWMTLNARKNGALEEIDVRLSEPSFDRLRESAHLFPCFWPSFRTRPLRNTGTEAVEERTAAG